MRFHTDRSVFRHFNAGFLESGPDRFCPVLTDAACTVCHTNPCPVVILKQVELKSLCIFGHSNRNNDDNQDVGVDDDGGGDADGDCDVGDSGGGGGGGGGSAAGGDGDGGGDADGDWLIDVVFMKGMDGLMREWTDGQTDRSFVHMQRYYKNIALKT